MANAQHYIHFLFLHCAIKILVSPRLCISHNSVAKLLLRQFVTDFSEIYGEDQVSFNVHSLIHLPDDALKFGPLDSFSAFCFESYLTPVKSLIKAHTHPLEQVSFRLIEKKNASHLDSDRYPNENTKLTILGRTKVQNEYNSIIYLRNKLSNVQPNNYVMSKKKEILRISKFININSIFYVEAEAFDNRENVYSYPLKSEKLFIFKCVTKFNNKSLYPLSSIFCKLVGVDMEDNKTIFISMSKLED